MKKRNMFVLFVASLTLAACSTNGTEEAEDETEEVYTTEEEAGVADPEEPDETVVTDEELEPASEEELEQAEMVDSIDDYEEFSEQDVFVPEDFDAYLITDDNTRREFVFLEGDEQAFKSIYIIEDNRLKVINLIDDEVLMNDPI